jgi:hypothetical protein
MDFNDRLVLLKELLYLNKQGSGLPDGQIANFVTFLAEQTDATREAMLKFVKEGECLERFALLVNLANMNPTKRNSFLKAAGIQAVKQTVNDLASVRETVQKDFLGPLSSLFGSWKRKA